MAKLNLKEKGNFQKQINDVKKEVNKLEDQPVIPTQPAEGNHTLTSKDGVLSWEEKV